MSMLEQIKPRIGIFYSTPEKDAEVGSMIAGATEFFKGAGWDISTRPSPLAVEALVLYCKMAQNTDPAALSNHPVLLSFIVQGRAERREADADAV